jgi:hypothetical protein
MAEGGGVERVIWIDPLSTLDFLPAPKIDMETSENKLDHHTYANIYTFSAINHQKSIKILPRTGS